MLTKKNKFKRFTWLLLSIVGLHFSTQSFALCFQLPSGSDDVVGKVQTGIVESGENFAMIARRFDVGYYELVASNPGVDPDNPYPGTVLIIPSQFVLPDGPRVGLVINVVEMSLYYFPPNSNTVYVFPVGIGREGWETPLGNLSIIQRIPSPTWHAPKSIREDRAKEGVYIPEVVPPGPENPLGEYAMRLSNCTYLIHGTNDPSGVGRRSSAGCVRMYPEDIKKIYGMAQKGTPVRVINYPYKAGWGNGKLYLEIHLPLKGTLAKIDADHATAEQVIEAAVGRRGGAYVNWKKAKAIANEQQGVPQEIGRIAH